VIRGAAAAHLEKEAGEEADRVFSPVLYPTYLPTYLPTCCKYFIKKMDSEPNLNFKL
jgi:hypothetical protein